MHVAVSMETHRQYNLSMMWMALCGVVLLLTLGGCTPAEVLDVQKVMESVQDSAAMADRFEIKTGELEGGRAVLLSQVEAAYWVCNGQAFAVNDKAKVLSPSLAQAPDKISHEDVYSVLGIVSDNEDMASPHEILLRSKDLSQAQVRTLETKLVEEPEDIASRRQLLCYYFFQRFDAIESKKKHAEHALWIIEQRPKDAIVGMPAIGLDPMLNKSHYEHAMALWKSHIASSPKDVVLLHHAAQFTLVYDREFAATCLQTCKALEPNNPKWPEQLAFLYSLHADDN